MTAHPDVERLMESSLRQEDRITEVHGAVGDLWSVVSEVRTAVRELHEAVDQDTFRQSIVTAIKEVRDDPETTQKLYAAFAGLARRGLAQYIGERVLTFIGVTAFVGSVAWAWATGHLK